MAESAPLALESTSAVDPMELQRYRFIVESTDDAILSKTLEGIVTTWNPGAERIFGYSAAEVIGQSVLLLFPEHKIDEEAYFLGRIRAGERVDHYETVRRHKDGRLIDVSVTISPMRDSTGHIVGASKIARDITARKESEAQRRLAATLIESSDDAILSKNLDGIVTSWNGGARRLFGYEAEEIIGHNVLMLYPEGKHSEESFFIEQIRTGQRVSHYETCRRRRDGTLVHVSVTVSPIHDDDGQIVGVSSIARDITARRRAEANMRLATSVFEHTHEGVAIVDYLGRILHVNAAFERITGYTRREVIGRDPTMLAAGRQRPEANAAILDALRTQDHWVGEVWARRKNTDTFAGLLTVSAVPENDTSVGRYVALLSDITPITLQQEELKRQAQFDALTGLPNRLLLSDRLAQALARCDRDEDMVAIMYMDLDGFKAVNDTYGHDAGDALLSTVARKVCAQLRRSDTMSRLGGDEFALVIPRLRDMDQCVDLISRVVSVCATPVAFEGHQLRVTASIGVTLYPQDDSDGESLLRHADQAMYRAKRAGRNQHVFYTPDMDADGSD